MTCSDPSLASVMSNLVKTSDTKSLVLVTGSSTVATTSALSLGSETWTNVDRFYRLVVEEETYLYKPRIGSSYSFVGGVDPGSPDIDVDAT